MSNRLFGFLVLLFLLAGLLGVSAVEPGCTPAPRKTSHGEIMVEWEDAKLLAPAGMRACTDLMTEATWLSIPAEEAAASRSARTFAAHGRRRRLPWLTTAISPRFRSMSPIRNLRSSATRILTILDESSMLRTSGL